MHETPQSSTRKNGALWEERVIECTRYLPKLKQQNVASVCSVAGAAPAKSVCLHGRLVWQCPLHPPTPAIGPIMGVEWVTYPTLLPRTVSIWVGVVGVKAQAPPNPHDRADHGGRGGHLPHPTPQDRRHLGWGCGGKGSGTPPTPMIEPIMGVEGVTYPPPLKQNRCVCFRGAG